MIKKSDYDEESYYQKVAQDLFPLILMTKKFEEFISDYALMKNEDLWDEDFGMVIRAFFFERGDQEYIISITPEGLLRRAHTKYPAQLSIQVHNVIAAMHTGGWFIT